MSASTVVVEIVGRMSASTIRGGDMTFTTVEDDPGPQPSIHAMAAAFSMVFGLGRRSGTNQRVWSSEPEDVIDVEGRVVEHEPAALPAGEST